MGQFRKPPTDVGVIGSVWDDSNYLLHCFGTVATSTLDDAGAYQKGCMYIKTDVAAGTPSLYENVGTLAVPSWDLVGAVAPDEIALAEGNVMVGNASGVGVALDASADTQILVGNGTTITSVALSQDATMTNAGVVTVVSANGVFSVGGKLSLFLSGGAASASGLLLGAGTSVAPATTAVDDAKFIEIRAQSTATAGDNRLAYLRYSLSGTGGGECIRAFTKLEAAVGTARGAHISLDIATAGSASGLGVGVDNQILVHDGALAGGTYAVGNFEIYSAGSSTDVSGATEVSLARFVLGGDSTGAANVDDNAFLLTLTGGSIASGNIVEAETDETKFSHKIRCKFNGTTLYLMATET